MAVSNAGLANCGGLFFLHTDDKHLAVKQCSVSDSLGLENIGVYGGFRHIAVRGRYSENWDLIGTNSMNIATELMAYKRFDVVMLGGNVRINSHSVVGPLAHSVLRNFSGYKLFLGVDSFSVENGVSTPSLEEALLNQMMIQQASKVIAVFDSSKFNKRSFVHIAEAKELDCIITDRAIPTGLPTKLQKLGIDLRLV